MVLGNKTKKTKNMRNAAISLAGKTSKPRFINMKELPQIMDKKASVAICTVRDLKSIFCIGRKSNSISILLIFLAN